MATKQSELVTDDVYARLRDLILSNVLRSGQKLVDRDLAEQLGVSRTPIREALGRLAMTGLVEARPRRGCYVSQISAEQVTDLYEFRKILEVSAAQMAAQNARRVHLREFDRLLKESKMLSSNPTNHGVAVKLDWGIHDLIARASGNESLHKAVKTLLDRIMCFIWVDDITVDTSTLRSAHRQHQALIRMIKKKNAKGAAEIMHAHIDNAQQRLTKVFRAREDLRSAVLARNARTKGASTRGVPNTETQLGGTS